MVVRAGTRFRGRRDRGVRALEACSAPPARERARVSVERAVDFHRLYSRKDALVRIRARSRRRVRSRPTNHRPRRNGASEHREKWLETRLRIRAPRGVRGEETDLARRVRHAEAELGARHRTVHDVGSPRCDRPSRIPSRVTEPSRNLDTLSRGRECGSRALCLGVGGRLWSVRRDAFQIFLFSLEQTSKRLFDCEGIPSLLSAQSGGLLLS